jgi:hypothetical protein
MTKLLEQALTTVSAHLNPEGQSRLARLMIRNLGPLEEILEDALDEQVFESCAREAIDSEKVPRLRSFEDGGVVDTDELRWNR